MIHVTGWQHPSGHRFVAVKVPYHEKFIIDLKKIPSYRRMWASDIKTWLVAVSDRPKVERLLGKHFTLRHENDWHYEICPDCGRDKHCRVWDTDEVRNSTFGAPSVIPLMEWDIAAWRKEQKANQGTYTNAGTKDGGAWGNWSNKDDFRQWWEDLNRARTGGARRQQQNNPPPRRRQSGSYEDAAELLGVTVFADEQEIKKAWRIKARQHHPDLGGDPEKMKEINQARDLLASRWRS